MGTLMPYDDAVQSDSCAVEISSDVQRSRRSIMSLFSLLLCRYSLSRRVKYIQYSYSSKMLPFFITLCRWTLCWCVTYLWWSYCSLTSPSCGYFFMLKLDFRVLSLMQPSSFSNSSSCSRPPYSWPSLLIYGSLGAWLRLNRLFGSSLCSRLRCLVSFSQRFDRQSNQLVTAGDFNPPEYNGQVPFTAEPGPPPRLTGCLNYIRAGCNQLTSN